MSNLKEKYPDLYKKFIEYKKDRKNDTRSSEKRKIARDEITKRLQVYREQRDLVDEDLQSIIQKQNELIEKQAAEINKMRMILEDRFGSPLKTVNRDSPLTLVYPDKVLTKMNEKKGGKYKSINKTRKLRQIKKIKKN